jgi:hypothetical protein
MVISVWTSLLVHQWDGMSWGGREELGEEDEDMPKMRGFPINITPPLGDLPTKGPPPPPANSSVRIEWAISEELNPELRPTGLTRLLLEDPGLAYTPVEEDGATFTGSACMGPLLL